VLKFGRSQPRCLQCWFVCGLPEELVKHTKEAHAKCNATECPRCSEDVLLHNLVEHTSECVAKWNTCSKCGKGFHLKTSLISHLNSSVSCGNRHFSCKMCDFQCKDPQLLKRYVKKAKNCIDLCCSTLSLDMELFLNCTLETKVYIVLVRH
jgi:hypothetical protein